LHTDSFLLSSLPLSPPSLPLSSPISSPQDGFDEFEDAFGDDTAVSSSNTTSTANSTGPKLFTPDDISALLAAQNEAKSSGLQLQPQAELPDADFDGFSDDDDDDDDDNNSNNNAAANGDDNDDWPDENALDDLDLGDDDDDDDDDNDGSSNEVKAQNAAGLLDLDEIDELDDVFDTEESEMTGQPKPTRSPTKQQQPSQLISSPSGNMISAAAVSRMSGVGASDLSGVLDAEDKDTLDELDSDDDGDNNNNTNTNTNTAPPGGLSMEDTSSGGDVFASLREHLDGLCFAYDRKLGASTKAQKKTASTAVEVAYAKLHQLVGSAETRLAEVNTMHEETMAVISEFEEGLASAGEQRDAAQAEIEKLQAQLTSANARADAAEAKAANAAAAGGGAGGANVAHYTEEISSLRSEMTEIMTSLKQTTTMLSAARGDKARLEESLHDANVMQAGTEKRLQAEIVSRDAIIAKLRAGGAGSGSGSAAPAADTAAPAVDTAPTEATPQPGADYKAAVASVAAAAPPVVPATPANMKLVWPDKRLEFGLNQRLTVGRRAGNDITIADPLVSGKHAVIQDGFLVDEGSTNGTIINEKNITYNIKHHLKPGDIILFGDTKLHVKLGKPYDDQHNSSDDDSDADDSSSDDSAGMPSLQFGAKSKSSSLEPIVPGSSHARTAAGPLPTIPSMSTAEASSIPIHAAGAGSGAGSSTTNTSGLGGADESGVSVDELKRTINRITKQFTDWKKQYNPMKMRMEKRKLVTRLAEEQRKLEGRLQDMEFQVLYGEEQDEKNELTARTQMPLIKEKLDMAQQRIVQLEDALRDSKSKISDLEQSLKNANSASSENKASRAADMTELKLMRERVSQLESDVSTLRSENSLSKARLEIEEGRIQELKESTSELRTRADASQNEVKTVLVDLSDAQAARAKAENELTAQMKLKDQEIAHERSQHAQEISHQQSMRNGMIVVTSLCVCAALTKFVVG
jgi:pSer/pThr/pTyr-binding forkhead associated (FHA) protein